MPGFKKTLQVLCSLAACQIAVVVLLDSGVIGGGKDPDRAILAYVGDVLKSHKTGLSRADEDRLAGVIFEEARAGRLDPLFVMAIIKTESGFHNFSASEKGAIGLMQILPSTGKALAKELNLRWDGRAMLFNPYLNVKMGVYYFTNLRGIYRGDAKKTLTAYNYGPTYLDEDVPEAFADRVLANYVELKKGAVNSNNGSRN